MIIRVWRRSCSRVRKAELDAAVSGLLRDSAPVRELSMVDGLAVIGGLYSLETGAVDFFGRIL